MVDLREENDTIIAIHGIITVFVIWRREWLRIRWKLGEVRR